MMKIIKFLSILLLIPQVCFGAASTDFNGTTSDVSVGFEIETVISGAGSVFWWADADQAYNGSTTEVWWGGVTNDGAPEFSCQRFSDNNIYCGYNASGNDDRVTLAASATNFPQNTWAHYALTWTNTGTTTLYVNGVSVGTKGSTTEQTTNKNFRFGEQTFSATQNWDGQMAYTRILSINAPIWEVSENLHRGESFSSSKQVEYGLLEGSGTAPDLSGNGRTGTYTSTSGVDSNGPPVMFGGGLPL
jgi:hypothetical protein